MKISLATINVDGLYAKEDIEELHKAISKMDIDIWCLTETHLRKGSGKWFLNAMEEDFKVFSKIRTKTKRRMHRASGGLAILINKRRCEGKNDNWTVKEVKSESDSSIWINVKIDKKKRDNYQWSLLTTRKFKVCRK